MTQNPPLWFSTPGSSAATLDLAKLPADAVAQLVHAALEVAARLGDADIEPKNEAGKSALDLLTTAVKGVESYFGPVLPDTPYMIFKQPPAVGAEPATAEPQEPYVYEEAPAPDWRL